MDFLAIRLEDTIRNGVEIKHNSPICSLGDGTNMVAYQSNVYGKLIMTTYYSKEREMQSPYTTCVFKIKMKQEA